MHIPNDLRRAAAEAFTLGIPWPEWFAEHREEIRKAEPYDARRFHRLVELVRQVVLTGSSAGQFAVGDPDASCEWFADGAGEQMSLFDTTPEYH